MNPAPDLFAYAEQYPRQAGWKARETAQAAAQAMNSKAPRLRQMCLDQLRAEPLTADEIADRLGIDKLSIRPRCSELAALNSIVDSGERRMNASGKRAVVWKAA